MMKVIRASLRAQSLGIGHFQKKIHYNNRQSVWTGSVCIVDPKTPKCRSEFNATLYSNIELPENDYMFDHISPRLSPPTL